LFPTAPLCHRATKEAASYFILFYSPLFFVMFWENSQKKRKGREKKKVM
jgi:hypothetical protein